MPIRTPLCSSLLVALMALCPGIAVAQHRGVRVRDSAGVHIVENLVPNGLRKAPRVGSTPILTIGADGSDPRTEFGVVTTALRLSDGSILVADANSLNMRLFDPRGGYLRTIGRKGAGPGDFQWIQAVFRLPKDTILAWDSYAHRLTWFDTRGEALRTVQVERPPMVSDPQGHRARSLLEMLGVLADGSLLAQHGGIRFDPPSGIYFDSMAISRVTRDGRAIGTISVFSFSHYTYDVPDNGMVIFGPYPFGPNGAVAVGASSMFHEDGAHPEIREYSPSGTLTRIIRMAKTSMPVTSREIAAYRSKVMDEVRHEKLTRESDRANSLAAQEKTLDWLVFPKVRPAFMDLRLDATGMLWARDYADSAADGQWEVFTVDGRWAGSVAVPPRLQVLEIGEDYLLARVRDADDVEAVAMYRVIR